MAEAAASGPPVEPVARAAPWPLLERSGLAVLGAAAFLTATLWAVLLPYNHAPDEADHFQLALYIASQHALPIYDVSPGIHHTSCYGPAGPCVGSYASQPPAAAILSAGLMAVAHAVGGVPYEQLVLAARMGSVIAYTAFSLLLALIALEVFRDRRVAWTAALAGAFIPQVVFVSSYVNDDALGMAAAAGVLYCSVLYLDRSPTGRLAVLAGCAAGLVVLGKLTAWIVLPAFAGTVLYRLVVDARAGRGRRSASRLGITAAVAAAGSGWWLLRNWLLYHDLTGAGVLFRAFERMAPDYRLHTLAGQGRSFFFLFHHTGWADGSYLSFWGFFDYLSLRMPDAAYAATGVFCLIAVGGAGVRATLSLARRDGALDARSWRLVALLAGVGLGTVLLSAWTSYANDYQAQGRYLFAALAPFSLFIAAGLHGWSRRPGYRSAVLGAVCVLAPLFAAYALVFVIVPAYYTYAS